MANKAIPSKNKTVTASKKSTGRVGGTNAAVTASKTPAKYTGGKNPNLIKVKGKK